MYNVFERFETAFYFTSVDAKTYPRFSLFGLLPFSFFFVHFSFPGFKKKKKIAEDPILYFQLIDPLSETKLFTFSCPPLTAFEHRQYRQQKFIRNSSIETARRVTIMTSIPQLLFPPSPAGPLAPRGSRKGVGEEKGRLETRHGFNSLTFNSPHIYWEMSASVQMLTQTLKPRRLSLEDREERAEENGRGRGAHIFHEKRQFSFETFFPPTPSLSRSSNPAILLLLPPFFS